MFKIRLSALALAGLSLQFTQHSGAMVLQEDFSSNPAAHGWQSVGQASLFAWNSTNQNLEVTWDSSQPNSFYCRPLGTILAAADDFNFSFDLRVSDVTVGVNPAKPYAFELAVGLVNLAEASRTNFYRGAGSGTPDLTEFDYFPDDGSGFPSLDATMSDTNGTMQFFYVDLPLSTGDTYRVTISYSAATKTVLGSLNRNGAPFCAFTNSFPNAGFGDFRLDHFAIASYSDAGQDPQFGGSILAHGFIDNIEIELPSPPVAIISGAADQGSWQVICLSQTNWLYTLERTTDFQSWSVASAILSGNGANLVLRDTSPPVDKAFYRVSARRP